MNKKIKVAIVFGGRSTEHQISLLSARNVAHSLDTDKYEAVLIGIDKSGLWHHISGQLHLDNAEDANNTSLQQKGEQILLSQNTNDKKIISQSGHNTLAEVDVIFPVLHGTFGEDGSIQGLAKLANIPCVGCGILSSSVGMDKDIMKRILRDSDINVAPWITIKYNYSDLKYSDVIEKLGHELFIKPANLGSSVGVSFTNNEDDFYSALDKALLYDHKVIIEQKIVGREIECAVLGNENPEASIPGEIVPKTGFYSFENKYLDENGAQLMIPADLDDTQIKAVQDISKKTFSLLECSGLTRVDMFLTSEDKIIINEVNTIPGFTNISMYPKLWEHSGLSQKDLVSKLIQLAIDKHNLENTLKLS